LWLYCCIFHHVLLAAFRIPRQKIIPYIQALHCVFFDNIGKETSFQVTWSETPNKWEKGSTANTIEVSHKDSDKKLFRTTFITTGTIQVQGNDKDIFVKEFFPVLKNVANSILVTSILVKKTLSTTCTEEPGLQYNLKTHHRQLQRQCTRIQPV
jgi:hypothetical protein